MKKQIAIHIGQYHASSEPTVIHTVLGSCVAACLIEPVNRIGGMPHILLPGKADMRHFDVAARYGINAMELLINRMMGLGADRRRLVAKVFGGAHVISAISRENGTGEKNALFVLDFLKEENIRILSKDIGGTDSRKIFFHTDTGNVFLKRLPPAVQTKLAEKEAVRFQRIRKQADKAGKITLW